MDKKDINDFIIFETLRVIKEDSLNLSMVQKLEDNSEEELVQEEVVEDTEDSIMGIQLETVEAKEYEEEAKEVTKLSEEIKRMKSLLNFKNPLLNS